MMKNPLDGTAREFEQYIVDLTLRIVRQRTVNYNPDDYPGAGPDGMDFPGMEFRVADILKAELKKHGIPFKSYAQVKGRDNILCSVGQKKPGYRKLLVLLHTDVVPSGDRKQWKRDPFDPWIEKGKIYGRGVLDDKGPLASSFAALLKLKQIEKEIPGEFIFGAVADEEVNIGVGLPLLTERKLIRCTDAIIPDIAGAMKEIDVAEKGRFVFRVEVTGKSAHAMNPEAGKNAITSLARIITAAQHFELKNKTHKLLGKPTINLGLVRGGSAPNAVADHAAVTFDVRFTPGLSEKSITAAFKALAEKHKLPGTKVRIVSVQCSPPHEVPASAPILKILKRHAPEAKPIGIGGGTFCKELVRLGIDAVGWAPGGGHSYHQPNEEIEIAQLTRYAERLAKIALDVCALKV